VYGSLIGQPNVGFTELSSEQRTNHCGDRWQLSRVDRCQRLLASLSHYTRGMEAAVGFAWGVASRRIPPRWLERPPNLRVLMQRLSATNRRLRLDEASTPLGTVESPRIP